MQPGILDTFDYKHDEVSSNALAEPVLPFLTRDAPVPILVPFAESNADQSPRNQSGGSVIETCSSVTKEMLNCIDGLDKWVVPLPDTVSKFQPMMNTFPAYFPDHDIHHAYDESNTYGTSFGYINPQSFGKSLVSTKTERKMTKADMPKE